MDLLTIGLVKITAAIGTTSRGVVVHAGGHLIHAEGERPRREIGAGPAPYDLVLAGLGACTFLALETHAARNRREIGSLQIVLRMRHSHGGLQIERTIAVEGLNSPQKTELAAVAEQTPVTLTLRSGATIKTRFT